MNVQQLYGWYARLPRLIRALVRRLTDQYFGRRGYPVAGPLAGCRMLGGAPLGAYLEGKHERRVTEIIVRLVQPGWVCADVGAHIGYFTLLLAKLVGASGRVIAFEAHPGNAQQVRINARINGYGSRIQVESVAVADGKQRLITLFHGPDVSSFVWNIVDLYEVGQSPVHQLEVPAVSLDNFFPQGSQVDFVKMDIEGAEAQALRGMRRLLRESNPFVIVEFHDQIGWAGSHELSAADYRLYDIQKGRWLALGADMGWPCHCLGVPIQRTAEVQL